MPSMSHVTEVPLAADVAKVTGLPVTVTNPASDNAGATAIQASEPAVAAIRLEYFFAT